jgi:hypothetical protein
MKNIKFILPTMALIFAIVASFASNNFSAVMQAKGLNGTSCQLRNLDGGKEIANTTGNCFTPDEGNGACTVTFDIGGAKQAWDPANACSVTALYIQD